MFRSPAPNPSPVRTNYATPTTFRDTYHLGQRDTSSTTIPSPPPHANAANIFLCPSGAWKLKTKYRHRSVHGRVVRCRGGVIVVLQETTLNKLFYDHLGNANEDLHRSHQHDLHCWAMHRCNSGIHIPPLARRCRSTRTLPRRGRPFSALQLQLHRSSTLGSPPQRLHPPHRRSRITVIVQEKISSLATRQTFRAHFNSWAIRGSLPG